MVNALVSINEVALHWAWLLLGWVTACRQVKHLSMYPTTYVNSSFHSSRIGKLVRQGTIICLGWQVSK